MSRSSRLGAVSYNTEASWGEDLTTFGTRLPVLTQVDVSGLSHEKQAPDRVVQYRNDDTLHIPMLMGGSFKLKVYLTGHGSATSGATSLSALETFLGLVCGNSIAASATGTTAAGTGTVTAPNVAAVSGFGGGTMCRIGSLGDGRGNGQFYAITSHAGSAITLLTGLPATLSNGDVIHSAGMIYPSENPGTNTISGMRFLLQTANLEYEAHGCYPTAWTLAGYNTGEVPTAEIEFAVSWWRYTTATFPSITAVDEHTPAACAAGSVFVNVFGTATSALRTVRSMTLNWTLGTQALMGVGGVNQYQGIVGAVRVPDDIRLTILEDAPAATTTPVLDGFWDSTSRYHVLCTLNPQATKAVGIYLPRMVVVGQRPQQRDDGGINRVAIELKAAVSTNTSGDLTLSAARIAFA